MIQHVAHRTQVYKPNPNPNPNPNQVRHLPAKARSNLDSLAHGLWLASRGPGRFVDNSFVDLTFE